MELRLPGTEALTEAIEFLGGHPKGHFEQKNLGNKTGSHHHLNM
jgi:hypothetical protein